MQRIHLVIELEPLGGELVRISVRAIGDVRPAGVPPWDPSEPASAQNVETGPSYSTARAIEGELPPELGQNVVDAIGMDVRRVLEARLRQYLDGRMPMAVDNSH